MDLTLSSEQEMLRDAVRALCERLSTPETVRAMETDDRGYRPDLWAELARMDVLGLLVPTSHGGSGWLPVEMAVVSEELGRALVPSPFVDTAVFAPALARAAGVDEAHEGIVSGEAVVSLAWHEPDRTDTEEGIALRAEPAGGGYALSGTKILVPFASSATLLLTLARTDAGVVVAAVEPSGLEMTREGTLASDARFRVRFDGATGVRVGADGWRLFEEAATTALVSVAAYAVGATQRAHELSVDYAKERVQFDKPIGAFQAISHPLADTATEIAGARTLVHQAAWALATERDAFALARMAKYHACEVFRRTAKLGHQVFGGIGFTLDIDIQLFMRRAKQLEVLWFGPRTLEEAIAAAELDRDVPLVTADAVASAAAER